MNRWLLPMLLLPALVVACNKTPKEDPHPAPSASAVAVATAAPSASSSASAKSTSSFAGTYSLKPGALFINDTKDYANVKQAKDDPAKNVGDGTLALDVGADGKVTGTVDTGPASPGVIDGSVLEGGEIRGFVRRKTPSDDGLTGTFAGKLAGDALTGTLSLAESNASILRQGEATLKKK